MTPKHSQFLQWIAVFVQDTYPSFVPGTPNTFNPIHVAAMSEYAYDIAPMAVEQHQLSAYALALNLVNHFVRLTGENLAI